METIEKIKIRCFFLGMALVFIWFLLCIDGSGLLYEVHSKWFGMSQHEIRHINYCGLMFTKIFIFLFFLVPYIACKLCGKKSTQ